MKQASRALIVTTLILGFNFIPGSTEAKNTVGIISDGDKTCHYTSDNGVLVKSVNIKLMT